MAAPRGEHRKLTTSAISDGGMSRPVVESALSVVAFFRDSFVCMASSVPPAKTAMRVRSEKVVQ